ncbi:MAG: NAD(P)H-dependent oxidoreductase [Oscillospiraceae bacterium]
MNVLIVYCHPSSNSFTYQVKEAFVKGASDGGNHVEISDLYAIGFDPVMSPQEYRREAFYDESLEVPQDVLEQQKMVGRADCIAFIYPDFWTAAPAMLEGWFQRVWTYGYAYGASPKIHLKKALFLVTMGGSLKDSIRKEQLSAMKSVMIGDRLHNRADECIMHVFDEMTRGYGNDENRTHRIKRFVEQAYEIGYNL